jgi:hypothetical protein
LEYNWSGTELGVRVEGETIYVYTDLIGPPGKNIEVNWIGTELGVRVEGEVSYTYVDLVGPRGNSIEYNWIGTELGVRVEGDPAFVYSDLKGDQGIQGDPWNQWQGDWAAGTYQALDAVAHNGSSWIANKTTDQEPSASATDWDIIAQRGTDGDGAGDVLGPASSVSGNFASFSDTTGKTIQDSGKKATDFETAGAAATVEGNLNTHTGNTTNAHGIDAKVDKIAGYSLVADTEIAKIHEPGSDDQDLSHLVEKVTGYSLMPDTHLTTHPVPTNRDTRNEAAFTKNSAFNKNFGTASGTVCQGNDSRLSDSRTPTAHASTHTDGTDDIQTASITQKGLLSNSDWATFNSKAAAGTNSDITSMTGLNDAGIPLVKVDGAIGLGNNTFTGKQVFKETADTVYNITDGAEFSIDPANGNIQTVTLGASRTPVATNFADGQIIELGIDDGAGYAITWTSVPVTWITPGGGGAAPTLAATGYTWIILQKIGTTIYGSEAGSA